MQRPQRMSHVQPPIMLQLSDHYKESTISFAQGVPFFPPPQNALNTLRKHLSEHPISNYGPDSGLPELRHALSLKLKKENGIKVDCEQIMVTAGANQAFTNVALAITDPGDEIILLHPYYFNFEMALRMFGIKPRIVKTDSHYQPDVEAIHKAINPRTRAIITISPNNPTGAVYSRKILERINTLCKDDGIYHISDEAYEYFTFGDEPHYSPAQRGVDHTITLHSFSKTFGMPAWRVGYMSYPKELHSELLKVQDTVVICTAIPSQLLALECLRIGSRYAKSFLSQMARSRKVILDHLQDLEDIINLPVTTGGFYFYLKMDSSRSGKELALRLIKEHDVAVVPGEPFGSTEGCYLRLSFGNVTPEKAEEGMERFVGGIRAIVEE